VHDNSQNFVEYFVQYNEIVQKAILFDSNQSADIEKLNGLLKLVQFHKFKLPENCKVRIMDTNNHLLSNTDFK
jgi:hypothetical protein